MCVGIHLSELTVAIKMAGVMKTEPARRPQLVSHTVVTANANRPTLPLEWQLGKRSKKEASMTS